jgi:archaemetzincin
MGFVRPDAERRLRAIGPVAHLPGPLQRAFDPDVSFEAVPPPGRQDWLNVAAEHGQAYEAFTRTATNRPDADRPHIYVQPLGDFTRAQAALLLQLRQFGGAFFMRDVRLLPPLTIADNGITERHNRYTDITQLKTRDILPLLARRLPADACCVLGVTVLDLYPDDGWSFVFGEAILDERVGVFSIARYDPVFYDKPADPALLLQRSCKVLAHETCHMFGVRHCIFFNCLMNGSNHLAESDRRPLDVCPVDLRKLHWSLGFDIVERYRQLRQFWQVAGVSSEAEWIERRIAFIEGR